MYLMNIGLVSHPISVVMFSTVILSGYRKCCREPVLIVRKHNMVVLNSLMNDIAHHYGDQTDLKPFDFLISSVLVSVTIMSFSGVHLFLKMILNITHLFYNWSRCIEIFFS